MFASEADRGDFPVPIKCNRESAPGAASDLAISDHSIRVALFGQPPVGDQVIGVRQRFANGETQLMLIKLAAKQMGDQLARGKRRRTGVMGRLEPFFMMFSQAVKPIVQPVKRAVVGR